MFEVFLEELMWLTGKLLKTLELAGMVSFSHSPKSFTTAKLIICLSSEPHTKISIYNVTDFY